MAGSSACTAQYAARMPLGMRCSTASSGSMSTSSGPVKQANAGMPSSVNISRWSSPITIAMSGLALASETVSASMAS